MTAEFLEASGVEVRVAGDGKSALEVADAFLPQIVVCDLMLPDLSGLGLAQALRSNTHTKHVVFALYSALAEADIRVLEREARGQIDLCFSKPLTVEKLKKLLRRLPQ